MKGWTDNELVLQIERVRQLPPDSACDEIRSVIEQHPTNGLRLATRALKRRADMERILRMGLERRQTVNLEIWLKAWYPRIGCRRVIAILREWIGTDAETVYHATYALRCLRTKHPEIVSESDNAIIKELWKDLAKFPSFWGLID